MPGFHGHGEDSGGAWLCAPVEPPPRVRRLNLCNLSLHLLGQETVGIVSHHLNPRSYAIGKNPNMYITFMNQTRVFAVFQQNILFGTNSARLQRCLGAAGCR